MYILFPTDTDSDVTSAASSVANNNDSNYLGSRRNSPKNHDTILDLSTIIEEIENLHEFVIKELAKINSPRALFTPGHKIDPVELTGGEETLDETPPEDGNMPLLHTQTHSKSSTPVDAPDAPDSPPQRLH